MTIQELIWQLQDLIDSGTPADAPVAVALQPTYPLEANICNVALDDSGDVYIATSEPTGYAPRDVWEA